MRYRTTRPIIFLDFDGVLIGDERRPLFPVRHLDPTRVAIFDTLVGETEALVVLTTAWRHPNGLTEEIMNVLRRDGMTNYESVISQTNYIYGGTRGDEIYSWLRQAGQIISPFCILDDIDLSFDGRVWEHVVKTNPRVGLTEQDAAQVKRILKK